MKGLIIAVLIALGFFFVSSLAFSNNHAILIAIIAFLVALWTNEALPLGAVSMLPLMLFPMFGILDFKAASVNYSKPIIFLFLGGFLLAIAVEKINLHKVIANKLLSIFPSTPRGMIYSLAMTSAFMSSFLSNTTTALMLTPIAMFLTKDTKLKVRFLLAVAYGASIGGIVTPIGTPPNLIYLGFVNDIGAEPISFFNWIFLTAPLATLMLLIVPFILSYGLESIKIQKHEESTALNKEQKFLSFVLIGLVATLLLNSPIKPFYNGLGMNEYMILLGFGLLMFFPKVGFLVWDDIKKFPFEILFLFGAGFTIASAVMSSGLAKELTGYIEAISDFPLIVILFLIAIFVSFSTEVTSNTALTSIAMPIFFEFSKNAGFNQDVIMLTATISASYAFMLPIATPPNAIAMSSGVVKIKQMAKIGFFINTLGAILLTLIAYFYWSSVL